MFFPTTIEVEFLGVVESRQYTVPSTGEVKHTQRRLSFLSRAGVDSGTFNVTEGMFERADGTGLAGITVGSLNVGDRLVLTGGCVIPESRDDDAYFALKSVAMGTATLTTMQPPGYTDDELAAAAGE